MINLMLGDCLDRMKEPPFLNCTNDWCTKKFQAYHGKVGCKCYECDDVTPERSRINQIGK